MKFGDVRYIIDEYNKNPIKKGYFVGLNKDGFHKLIFSVEDKLVEVWPDREKYRVFKTEKKANKVRNLVLLQNAKKDLQLAIERKKEVDDWFEHATKKVQELEKKVR